jgi:hypothetical protein
MLTTTRRTAAALAAAALASGALIGAAVPEAQAASWSSKGLGAVSTWHCAAQLVAHWDSTWSQTNVSGYMRSNGVYQSDGHLICDMRMQVSTNNGQSWSWEGSEPQLDGPYESTVTPSYNDNTPRISRLCLLEWYYEGPSWTYRYGSGLRCTTSW